MLSAKKIHEDYAREHSQKHSKKMSAILIDAWCLVSELQGNITTSTTVEVCQMDPKLITYTEQFRMYLGDDESQRKKYSNWFEISCEASKVHPSLIAKVLLPIHTLNELDALKLANSINQHSSCAVSLNEKCQFQVNTSVSFVGYFDVDDAAFDHAVAQSEVTLNMFVELLATSLELYKVALE